MASRYEVEVTIVSAKDLKNVNWRHGRLKPYAVVWVVPRSKVTTRVDEEGDTCPYWDQKLVIPFNTSVDDSYLYIDVVHAKAAEGTKPLVGSARLPLRDVALGERTVRKLELTRPSGRPHGKLDVKVAVRETRYQAPDPYYAQPYGVPPQSSRDPYSAAPPTYGGSAYGAPPASPYQAGPPAGYPSSYSQPAQPSYGQPAQPSYGQPGYGGYGQGETQYGQQQQQQGVYGQPEQKKKGMFGKMGTGTGLAVGALAGVLGGIALVEGAEFVEDKIADDAADRVEDRDDDDDRYDDGGYGGGGYDDDY